MNPYQSPLAVDRPSDALTRRADSVSRNVPRNWFDRIVLFTVAVATGLHGTFAWLMLGQGSLDFVVGVLFLFNVPVLLIWLVQLSRIRRVGIAYGLVAAAVQLIVLLVMVSVGLYNDPIVMINLAVASVYGVLGLICHFANLRLKM